MKILSTSDKTFLNDVQSLIRASEVLIIVRHVYGAGSRDFFILKNMADFNNLLRELRPRYSVIVMKSFEKIKEGIVDQAFLDNTLAKYSPGLRWLLICADKLKPHFSDWAFAETSDELQEELQTRFGDHIYIVAEPDWNSEDLTVEAFVPDDGIVRPGVY